MIKQEDINVSGSGMELLLKMAEGDMRRSLQYYSEIAETKKGPSSEMLGLKENTGYYLEKIKTIITV